MKIIYCTILLGLVLFSQGCSTSSSVDSGKFDAWLSTLTDNIKNSKSYKRIPINTDEQSEDFIALLHDAYNNKISKLYFIEEMLEDYPDSKKSIEWIASQLP